MKKPQSFVAFEIRSHCCNTLILSSFCSLWNSPKEFLFMTQWSHIWSAVSSLKRLNSWNWLLSTKLYKNHTKCEKRFKGPKYFFFNFNWRNQNFTKFCKVMPVTVFYCDCLICMDIYKGDKDRFFWKEALNFLYQKKKNQDWFRFDGFKLSIIKTRKFLLRTDQNLISSIKVFNSLF